MGRSQSLEAGTTEAPWADFLRHLATSIKESDAISLDPMSLDPVSLGLDTTENTASRIELHRTMRLPGNRSDTEIRRAGAGSQHDPHFRGDDGWETRGEMALVAMGCERSDNVGAK